MASVIRATNPAAAFASLSGPTTQFAYTVNGYGASPPTTWPETSVVTDPNNNQVTSRFDSDSLPKETIDGRGVKTSTNYTSNANVRDFTLATNTGTTPNTTLSYDSDNNLSGSLTPTGSTSDSCPTPSTCKH